MNLDFKLRQCQSSCRDSLPGLYVIKDTITYRSRHPHTPICKKLPAQPAELLGPVSRRPGSKPVGFDPAGADREIGKTVRSVRRKIFSRKSSLRFNARDGERHFRILHCSNSLVWFLRYGGARYDEENGTHTG